MKARSFIQPNTAFESFRVQFRILHALMIREGLTHYGHENLGFFWVMGEPLLLSLGVMGMWKMAGFGGHTYAHGVVGIIPMALSSYVLLTHWRHVTAGSVHVMRNNAGLLFHRNIKTLDIIIARTLLDGMGALAAFMIACVPLTLYGLMEPIADPLLVVGAWALQVWISLSVGLVIAGLSEMYEAVEHFVAPILYITLPLTGAFYLVDWLPSSIQDLVLWSPLVDINEMFRAGVFGSDVIRSNWGAGYTAICCILLTCIGLVVVRKAGPYVRMG